jgi:hypothetical protein
MRLRPIALLLPAAIGCSPVPVYQCTTCFNSVIAYGRVTSPDGRAVANATIVLSTSITADPRATAGMAISDASGFYRAKADLAATPYGGYVNLNVLVTPPGGSGLSGATTSTGVLQLGRVPPDSARVDIALAALPTEP